MALLRAFEKYSIVVRIALAVKALNFSPRSHPWRLFSPVSRTPSFVAEVVMVLICDSALD